MNVPEPVWIHASDGGPVRFTIRGGFCQECQAGPLHPYADDPAARYMHRDDADQLAANAAPTTGDRSQ